MSDRQGAMAWAKVAGGLSVAVGLGFGLPGLLGAGYFAEHGEVWRFMGFPTYGEGPFESVGIQTSVPLLSGFVAVCAAEVAVGGLLWSGRRSGPWVALALLPVEAAYWIGFALPVGPILGAARTVAAVAALARGSARSKPAHSS